MRILLSYDTLDTTHKGYVTPYFRESEVSGNVGNPTQKSKLVATKKEGCNSATNLSAETTKETQSSKESTPKSLGCCEESKDGKPVSKKPSPCES